jgi:hypothetical protein
VFVSLVDEIATACLVGFLNNKFTHFGFLHDRY